MTIYQIEQERGSNPYYTTDCRELLSNGFNETTSPFTLYISREYNIEDKDETYDGEEYFLVLDSSIENTAQTFGTSTHWSTKCYVDNYECIRVSKKLVDETIHLLNMEDQITSFDSDGRVYITVTKEFSMHRLMLLVTLMLIYSETPQIESLEEYFKLGLEKISDLNSTIEPTNYSKTRMPAILILYYFYSNNRKYDWIERHYSGITDYPVSIHEGYRQTPEWKNFKQFIKTTVFNSDIKISDYFMNYFYV